MKKRLQRLIRQAESGVTLSIQSIYYIFILFLFFALTYDFGNVAYTASAGRAAAYAIAYKAAANSLDTSVFLPNQEVRRNEDGARTTAEAAVGEVVAEGMPLIENFDFELRSIGPTDIAVVKGTVDARTPLLGYLFGINVITINVEGYADAPFGAGVEGQ
jgi:hypothetical protein